MRCGFRNHISHFNIFDLHLIAIRCWSIQLTEFTNQHYNLFKIIKISSFIMVIHRVINISTAYYYTNAHFSRHYNTFFFFVVKKAPIIPINAVAPKIMIFAIAPCAEERFAAV